MPYTGFYINLDRRSDRRAEIEAELTRHNALNRYQRFRAVDGAAQNLTHPSLSVGAMGVFHSHTQLLQDNRDSTRPLHIIEDDVLFCPYTLPVIDGIIEQNLFAGCDILYTDVFVPIQTAAYKAYRKFFDAAARRDADGKLHVSSFSAADLTGLPFGSMSSYLVPPQSISKCADLFAEELARLPSQPIDIFVRKLSEAGKIKVGCIMPFVTSVRLDEIVGTDIERGDNELSQLAAHLGRYSFFAGADLNLCQTYIDKYLPLPASQDTQRKIFNHLMAYSLTDAYVSF